MAVGEHSGKSFTLLNAQTTVGAGDEFIIASTIRTVQVSLLGGTSPTATVLVEGSNDPSGMGWATAGTVLLSGTGDSGLVAVMHSTIHIRARVTAITGGGAITAKMVI